MKNNLTNNYSIQQFADAIQEVSVELKKQHTELAEYYTDIPLDTIMSLVPLMLSALYRRGATAWHFHLMYQQSIQVRADIPTGALYISVIFGSYPEDEEDEADIIWSEYDVKGQHVGGKVGRFITAITEV